VTFLALVAIVVLAAGGLIVVMFAIAHTDDGAKPAPRDASSPRDTTTRAQKPPRRPAWHRVRRAWRRRPARRGIRRAWGSWRDRRW
jgi:hypothetical protein